MPYMWSHKTKAFLELQNLFLLALPFPHQLRSHHLSNCCFRAHHPSQFRQPQVYWNRSHQLFHRPSTSHQLHFDGNYRPGVHLLWISQNWQYSQSHRENEKSQAEWIIRIQGKRNVSKAKIHPVTITDIEELPWLINFPESVYLNLFIS